MAILYLVQVVFVTLLLHVLHAQLPSLNASTVYMIYMDLLIGAELVCQDTTLLEAYARLVILHA